MGTERKAIRVLADFLGLRRNMVALLAMVILVGLGEKMAERCLRFPDDHENLARQFDVYDALYAWCRLQAAREG